MLPFTLTDVILLVALLVPSTTTCFLPYIHTDNLGNLLREDPTARGLLYLCGCFLPLMHIWTFKMYFNARYLIQGGNDVFHQCFDMAILLALATAALHIRPVAILSNPGSVDGNNNYDMFAFSASVGMASLLHLGQLLEVAICQGFFHTKDLFPEAFFAVRHEALYEVPTVLCYLAAVIYSGLQYFGQHDDDDRGQTAHGNSSYTGHRSLASGETSSYSTQDSSPTVHDDVAIWLLLGGSFIGIIMMILDVFCFKKEDHKKYVFFCNKNKCSMFCCIVLEQCRVDASQLTFASFSVNTHPPTHRTTVPMNIGYGIHRYGELVMLLLGER